MDETALRALIASLGQQLTKYEWWMYVSTAAVIAGCAGELIFVIREYLEDRNLWYETRTKGFAEPPGKPSGIFFLLEVISVALVVLGIAGELYVDRKSSDLQTRLRSTNENLVLLLEKEAGNAKQSADAAAVAAGNAQRAADQANASALGAQKKEELLAKKEELVEEDAKSLEYLIEMAARDLNPPTIDRKSFTDFFKKYKGKAVTFKSYANDGEPYFLCTELADIATSAEMLVTEQCGIWKPTATPIRGIAVSSPTVELSAEFTMFLTSQGIGGGGYGASNGSSSLQIFVGTRYGFPTIAPKLGKVRRLTPEEIRR